MAPRGSDLRIGSVLRALALAGLFEPACAQPTEIVLAIDTDLGVPAEMNEIQISVSGPSQSAGPFLVDLTAPNRPSFPLTLGLTPGGALSPVSIAASAIFVDPVGIQPDALVVTREIQTAFVDRSSRLLPILLTLSCRDIVCPTDQTCDQGMCIPIQQAGDSLSVWTGAAPAPLGSAPTLIGGRSVWAGGWHSCATKGSSFSCWGRNGDGELGIGPPGVGGTPVAVTTRREVVNLPPPVSVGLGQDHTCTCDHTGQAWCWGLNADAELGVGDLQDRDVPTAVQGMTDCVQITGGGFHTCAVLTNGAVSCWGRNSSGQCGQPASTAPIAVPHAVPGLSGVVEVRAGETYTCARQTNTAVVCWGDNSVGQLGDGTLTSRETPGRIMSATNNAAEVSAGRVSACMRLGTGHVYCWGNNPPAGIGTAGAPARVPAEVAGIVDAIQISTGHQHACVLHATGVVSCWGSDQYNQLGDGKGLDSATPVDVPILTGDATSIAAGIVHSCARVSSGAIFCWGQDILQQLGDGSTSVKLTPVEVVGF